MFSNFIVYGIIVFKRLGYDSQSMFPTNELLNRCDPDKKHQLVHESLHEINIHDKYGCTPLLCAIKSHDGNMVDLLLKHGADTSIPDIASLHSPLFEATTQCSIDIIELLLLHKTNPFESYTGKTACQFACLVANGASVYKPLIFQPLLVVKQHFRRIAEMLRTAQLQYGTFDYNRTPRPTCPVTEQTSHGYEFGGFGVQCIECGEQFHSPKGFEDHMKYNHYAITPYEMHALRSNEFNGPGAHHRMTRDDFDAALYDTESDSD